MNYSEPIHEEQMQLYYLRKYVKKAFSYSKNYLAILILRVHSEDALRSYLFLVFCIVVYMEMLNIIDSVESSLDILRKLKCKACEHEVLVQERKTEGTVQKDSAQYHWNLGNYITFLSQPKSINSHISNKLQNKNIKKLTVFYESIYLNFIFSITFGMSIFMGHTSLHPPECMQSIALSYFFIVTADHIIPVGPV